MLQCHGMCSMDIANVRGVNFITPPQHGIAFGESSDPARPQPLLRDSELERYEIACG